MQAEKDKEISQLKAEFERRLNQAWERQKLVKEDYQRDIEQIKKQLELQSNENAKLKVEVIDFTKSLENLKRKDQAIEV